MENELKQTFDLQSLFKQVAKNWYWFLISLALCCALGMIYFLSAPVVYNVEARIQVRPGEETTFMPGAGVIQAASLNRSIEIGDEKALISSRDIFASAIEELGIQAAYATKKALRWTEVSRRSSDVVVVCEPADYNRISGIITVYVKPRKNDVVVKIKRKHHPAERFVVANLDEPFMTDYGFAIQARKELKAKNYRIQVTSTNLATILFSSKAKCVIPPKTRTILDLKLETKRPSDGCELLAKQIEIYNRLTVDNRQQLATNVTEFIDERLETIADVKKSSGRASVQDKEVLDQLGLFLSQKREEKALTLRAPAMPAIEVIKPHVCSDVVSPRLTIILIFCVFLGIAIPFIVIISIVMLSGKIYGRKQFEDFVEVPYLGEILQGAKDEQLVVGEGANTPVAEQFRILRMDILRQLGEKNKVLMVTSSNPGEGATYVASNVALSLGLLDKKVALVDLNLRRPAVAELFGKPNKHGVTDYLQDVTYAIENLIVPSGKNKNVDLLLSGATPMNPSELLQRERLEQLFAVLRKQYDYVVVDSTPMMSLSDSFLANRVCNMTLFVANGNTVTKDEVEFINHCAAQQRLANVAVVLNNGK